MAKKMKTKYLVFYEEEDSIVWNSYCAEPLPPPTLDVQVFTTKKSLKAWLDKNSRQENLKIYKIADEYKLKTNFEMVAV